MVAPTSLVWIFGLNGVTPARGFMCVGSLFLSQAFVSSSPIWALPRTKAFRSLTMVCLLSVLAP